MDVSGSMVSQSISEIQATIKTAQRLAEAHSVPIMIDVQHDFSWPVHSLSGVTMDLDPLEKACSLFNQMKSAQIALDAAKKAYHRHLIEYNISRKNVGEKIEKNEKLFQKISDHLRKHELSSDQCFTIPGGTT